MELPQVSVAESMDSTDCHVRCVGMMKVTGIPKEAGRKQRPVDSFCTDKTGGLSTQGLLAEKTQALLKLDVEQTQLPSFKTRKQGIVFSRWLSQEPPIRRA
jgi:hypothetical protein